MTSITTDLQDFTNRRKRLRRLRLFNPLEARRRRNRQSLNMDMEMESSSSSSSVVPEVPNSKKGKMYFTCFAIVFAWISLGTLFYYYYYAWPLPQSFFYAVDAGMSIGFCTDVAETDAASRAFTIVHILLGASCVGGALVLMVQSVLEGVASREAAVYAMILERDSLKKSFFGLGRSGGYYGYWSTVLDRRDGILSYDEFREVLHHHGLRNLTNKEYDRITSYYDPHSDGYIRYENFIQNYQGLRRIVPTSRFVHYKSLPLRTIAWAIDTISSLFTNQYYRIYLIFVLWIGMGITWGILDQGWDQITATHFAVSALATGGLTAPPVDERTGILPAGPALFCGFYCLFGIPLMALTLGIFARVLVEGYIVEEELAAITRPLSKSEFGFASKSLCSTDNALHLSDYIVLQLMRQGKLSLESFEFMKRQYQDQRRFWRFDPD